jgi:hypothetical protein
MRLLTLLLLIAGAISGVILFKNWRRDVQHQRLVDSMKAQLQPVARPAPGGPLLPDEAAYYKLMAFMQKSAAAGNDIDDLLSSAIDSIGITGGRATLVKTRIMDAYNLMMKHKVFEDTATIVALGNGQAPVIKSGPWKDQALVLSQTIPPLLAHDIARDPANLRLLPESVRDAHDSLDPASSPGLLDAARILRSNSSISAESFERVMAQIPQQK